MLLKHQYLKFAYVDIVLLVSKMFRGNLTADMLAIGVTVVLISETDTTQCTSDIDNSVAKRSDTGKTVVYYRTRHLAGKLFLYFIH